MQIGLWVEYGTLSGKKLALKLFTYGRGSLHFINDTYGILLIQIRHLLCHTQFKETVVIDKDI